MKKLNIFLIVFNIIISISLIVMILLYLNAINISKKNIDSILNAGEENFEAFNKIAELEAELAKYKNKVTDNTINSNTENEVVSDEGDKIEYLENIKINEIQKGNTDYILLYNGFEIEKNAGAQYMKYKELTDENTAKYSINYYNYNNNNFTGVSKGNFGKEIEYGIYSKVYNVDGIATSQKFDLFPRKIEKVENIPAKIKNKDNEIKTTLVKIDLDGDNKFEYIAVETKKYDVDLSEGFIKPGVMEYSSTVILYNENFEKIDTLITINDDYADTIEYFTDIDDIKFLDIDNDGIVEILVEFPVWEGPVGVSIYKYNNGKLEGDVRYIASITP